MSPGDAETVELVLERRSTAPAHARREVTAMCHDLHRDVTTIATLLTSELVTNALLHGSGEIEMKVDRTPGQLRVEVQDESDVQPVRQSTDVESTRGRGLLLLETLANSWGVRKNKPGKCVWFTLRLLR